MGRIVLDSRLQAVADLVRPGVIFADIGTDHGYLACHLVATRKCPRGFACDIAAGPLSRARQVICREGLDARIMTIQCNGLSGIPEDAVSDIIIAGMGGDLIGEILLDWKGCRDGGKRFILQPVSKPEHLRRILYREGFVLLDEVAVLCGGFVYTVMLAQHTGHRMDVSHHFAYTGLHWHREPCEGPGLAYLQQVCGLCRKKAAGYAASREEKHLAVEFERLAVMIEEKTGRG